MGTAAAALVHVPRTTITFDHVPVETTTRRGEPFPISATVTSVRGELVPDSMRLFYRIGQEPAFTELPLRLDAATSRWMGELPALRCPSTVEYYFRAADGVGPAVCCPREAPADCYSFDVATYCSTFDGDWSGWSVGDPADGATKGIWECVVPVGSTLQPASDRRAPVGACWITGQHVEGSEPGADDVDGGSTTLLSPAYDLRDARSAQVKYWRWYSNDLGAGGGEDAWEVSARMNGGPWVEVERTASSNHAWTCVTRDLVSLFGPVLGTVEFRFVASDAGIPSAVEAALDDFAILADMQGGTVLEIDESDLRVGVPAPNPFRAEARIELTTNRSVEVWARIHGLDGRVVRVLSSGGMLEPGRHTLIWDGRDEDGRALPSGVYPCMARLDGRLLRWNLILIR
jgi:hypothetical protein